MALLLGDVSYLMVTATSAPLQQWEQRKVVKRDHEKEEEEEEIVLPHFFQPVVGAWIARAVPKASCASRNW